MTMAVQERPTATTSLVGTPMLVDVPLDNAPVWVAWRCVCGAFLVAYDARYPCMLSRRCSKCKRECTLDSRHIG